ncbi:60S ribosomal protein L17-1 [Forsythia ovata]|uniref:60S ribosomal protein L17-1 n=1 Tax=Forsythia ovata TaxID=205694 RepID=A0ABD1PXD8_9LAMI
MRETAHAIRKLPLTKAKRYLEDVLAHKQAILFTRFCGDLLKNAESNAEVKGLDVDALYISHPGEPGSKAKAPHIPCSWKNKPLCVISCHIELILSQKEESVKKESELQLATSKSKKA